MIVEADQPRLTASMTQRKVPDATGNAPPSPHGRTIMVTGLGAALRAASELNRDVGHVAVTVIGRHEDISRSTRAFGAVTHLPRRRQPAGAPIRAEHQQCAPRLTSAAALLSAEIV